MGTSPTDTDKATGAKPTGRPMLAEELIRASVKQTKTASRPPVYVAPAVVIDPAKAVKAEGTAEDPKFKSASVIKPRRLLPREQGDAGDELFADEYPDTAAPEHSEPVAEFERMEAEAPYPPIPQAAQPRHFVPVPAPAPDRLAVFLAKKKRVAFHTSTGTIRMSVTDVLVSAFSITLVLPIDSDGCTFTPAIGIDFDLEFDGRLFKCCFPGFTTEVEELGLMFLTLVITSALKQQGSDEPAAP